jgi:hypothetical protein
MEIPCILNPDLICPNTCKFNRLATSVFITLLHDFNKTPEEELKILREPGFGKQDFRKTNATNLREAGVIENCQHFPDAEYQPGSDE